MPKFGGKRFNWKEIEEEGENHEMGSHGEQTKEAVHSYWLQA